MDYLVTESELTQLADTIRAHCGGFMPLMYPFEYITKIKNTKLGNYGDYGDLQGSSASRTTLNAGFQANTSITFVSFPLVSSITSSRAFRECSALREANFSILSIIPQLTFAGCSQLQKVNFPVCETIGFGAFFYCYAMKKAYFPNCKIINDASALGYTFTSNEYFSVSYSSTVKVGAFQRAGITEAYFPQCSSIGSFAFAFCDSLSKINFLTCESINNAAFWSCTNLTSAYFPSCTHLNAYTFEYCRALTLVNFPACLSIGSWAFNECSTLTSISFPVCTYVGEAAFSDCTALTNVYLPLASLIDQGAFQSCGLTMASFPECTQMSSLAFESNHALMSLYLLGTSVPILGDNVFRSTPLELSTYTGAYGSIFVRASMLSSFKAATNWVYYSDRFVGLTDEEIAALEGE